MAMAGEMVAEKIVRKEFVAGENEAYYFIKWQGRSEAENTWVKESDLDLSNNPYVMDEFLAREMGENLSLQNKLSAKDADGMVGFQRGLEPDRITGATDCGGELCFLMEWKGSNKPDIVPAKEANVKCPDVVIKFYEERIFWNEHRPLRVMLEDNDEDEGNVDKKPALGSLRVKIE